MVATTYGVANPINGAGSKSKGFFARLFEAIADSQIRPRTSTDGKLRSLNRLLKGWHDFARKELAQNLDCAGCLREARPANVTISKQSEG